MLNEVVEVNKSPEQDVVPVGLAHPLFRHPKLVPVIAFRVAAKSGSEVQRKEDATRPGPVSDFSIRE